MIDIDEYIGMWDDNLLGSEGVNDLMSALIAEVKRLREKLHLAEHYIKHDVWMEYAMQVLERDLVIE